MMREPAEPFRGRGGLGFNWSVQHEEVRVFTRSIAVFVAVVVLVTGSPAMAQSSDLLSSAERLALTTEVEQDQSVVRRRRSGGLAWTGGVLLATGLSLVSLPPVCGFQGEDSGSDRWSRANDGFFDQIRTHKYSETVLRGECTVRRDTTQRSYTYPDQSRVSREVRFSVYASDDNNTVDFGGREAPTNKTRNYIGWASVVAGGSLLAFGLRGVDVPVRFDVAPAGGFRVSRSLGW